MKFQLTCYVDADLIGPLTELIAPYSRVHIKLVEGDGPVDKRPIPASLHPPLKRRVASFNPSKGLGTVVVLRAVAKNANVQQIKAALTTNGLAPNGSGATLSKLRRKGFIRHLDKGVWALSTKGEVALKRLEGVATEAHEIVEVDRESVGG